jgi:hypothetical protein
VSRLGEGIEPLLESARKLFPRLSHPWLDAGYRGEEKGRGWVEKVLGWTVDLVELPRKLAPEEAQKAWAAEWAKRKARRFPGAASSVGGGSGRSPG